MIYIIMCDHKVKRGRKPKASKNTIDKVQIVLNQSIKFNTESNLELETILSKTILELKQSKDQYKQLLETHNRFKYLETVVSDNGTIDKVYYPINDVMVDEKTGLYYDKTDLYCTWCCHPFETIPIGLPESYCKLYKKFIVRDCFCSFNCAHAFNISLDDYKVWERYSLLNRIKNIIFKGLETEDKPIISASSKKMLKVFGGTQSIEEFRCNRISIPKRFILLMPPSIPIFSVIEEIPAFFSSSKNVSIYDKLRARNINIFKS